MCTCAFMKKNMWFPVSVPESCDEGSFRLVNGVIQNEGEIEVCINGVWGSICADQWDETDAYVLCQQLGYIDTGDNCFAQMLEMYTELCHWKYAFSITLEYRNSGFLSNISMGWPQSYNLL